MVGTLCYKIFITFRRIHWSFIGIAVVALCGPVMIFFLTQEKPYYSLLVPVGLGVFIAATCYPEICFHSIVALIPFGAWRSFVEGSPAITFSKIIGIILVIAVVLRLLFLDRSLHKLKSNSLPLLMLYIVGAIVSAASSPWFIHVLNHVRQLFQSVIFFLLIIYLSKNRGFTQRLSKTIVITCGLAGIILVVAANLNIHSMLHTNGGRGDAVRALGTDVDPNFMAAVLLYSQSLTAYFITRSLSFFKKVALGIIFICNSLGVCLTYSRSAMALMVIVWAAIVVVFRYHIKPRHVAILVLVSIAAAPFVIVKIPQSKIIERIGSLVSLFDGRNVDPSLLRRSTYWPVAVDAIKRRPFLGWGPGAFDRLYGQSKYAPLFGTVEPIGYFRRAHNTFLDIAVGHGLTGLGLFLALIFLGQQYLWKRFNRESDDDIEFKRAWGISSLSLFISFFFLSEMYHKYLWLSVAIGTVAWDSYQCSIKDGRTCF